MLGFLSFEISWQHSVQALGGGGEGVGAGRDTILYFSAHLTLSLTVSMLSTLYAHGPV